MLRLKILKGERVFFVLDNKEIIIVEYYGKFQYENTQRTLIKVYYGNVVHYCELGYHDFDTDVGFFNFYSYIDKGRLTLQIKNDMEIKVYLDSKLPPEVRKRLFDDKSNLIFPPIGGDARQAV